MSREVSDCLRQGVNENGADEAVEGVSDSVVSTLHRGIRAAVVALINDSVELLD